MALAVLYIISIPIFSNNFFKLVEGNEYRKPISAIDSTDAIVVLSGNLGINQVGDSTYVEWGDPDRYFGGIALFKAGKAQKLVFTGGKMPWDNIKTTEGEVLKEYAISNGIPSEKIFVTKNVENTEEEAIAVKKLISPKNRITLVTSAYHMNRAQRLYEKRGFEVISYKVDFKATGNSFNNVMNFLPSVENLELTEIGVRELLGRLFYQLKY